MAEKDDIARVTGHQKQAGGIEVKLIRKLLLGWLLQALEEELGSPTGANGDAPAETNGVGRVTNGLGNLSLNAFTEA
ncbi:hypothetical protein N0V91_005994 [Didymella pomorum]|uniref:Uncharacterized protein n=1 Tax=Didymella pomorum TaxID=749634 RepID=A0A9W8ZB86_9PLEO|nr:hypothetical protein N0V91_005994 [Didymella pomorum]